MLNANTILEAGGLLALGLTIFAESGLLLGIFLPGDTLLLAGGIFAGQGKLSFFWLNLVVIVAAVLGYQAGYAIGERTGPHLFKRKDGLLFREEYIGRTQAFLNKYGGITLIGARFIAHVRTLVSAIAGAGRMNRKKYLFYNIIGAILWSLVATSLGFWLGSSVPNIDKYFLPVIIGILVIIYLIGFWELSKNPRWRQNLKKGLKEDFDYFFRKGR